MQRRTTMPDALPRTPRRSTPTRAAADPPGTGRSSGTKRGRSPGRAPTPVKRPRAGSGTRTPVVVGTGVPAAARRASGSLNSAVSMATASSRVSSSRLSTATAERGPMLSSAAMSRAFLEQSTAAGRQLQEEVVRLRTRLEDQAESLQAATAALENKQEHADFLLDELRALEQRHAKEKRSWAEERVRLQEQIAALKSAHH
eukprot:TRINITY_DN14432_c0_g1_i1.p1 TRINITY_DN14432_c0_g1~~TRINITY_DN14432_c0_g1_i1.p1  ORF type:complete len:201 (+),score=49.67 TRINITY_DN14432_c0_g1_i1:45-647(+)